MPGCDIGAKNQSGGFENEPNWCGHGGGIWMSGHGPAATPTLQDGNYHIFFAAGNGGFQKTTTNGTTTYPSRNFGQSVMDFRVSPNQTTTLDTVPFQSFTAYGGGKLYPSPAMAQCGCTNGPVMVPPRV